MDALTEALNRIRLRSTIHCPTELRGQWGFRTEPKNGAVFHIVLEGGGWLEIEGREPVRLESGDFVVFPHGTIHTVRATLDSPVEPLMELLSRLPHGEDGIWRYGSGAEKTVAIGGCFFFEEAQTSPLLRALPTVLHIRGEQGNAMEWLEPTVRFIASEARSGRPGAETVITRLSDVLFIQAVRAYVCGLPEEEGNWLRAMAADPQIGQALLLIHQQPELPWKVETLATEVAMSRSSFAARFTQLVGEPVLQYLTRWRIHKAACLLREDGPTVAEIAAEVGYRSEAAFSRVFKQWTGQPPAAYRRAEV